MLGCNNNGNSCGAGPVSNNGCVVGDINGVGTGCNIAEEYCCKPEGTSEAALTCIPYGDECTLTGLTVIPNPDGENLDIIKYTGPVDNKDCEDANINGNGLGCDLTTQFCCLPSPLAPYECRALGADCSGNTVPAAAAVTPFDFESAAATKTDSNDMMSNGLGLSPTYYPTYYPTYTEVGNANDVALSQSQMMSNLDESSAIRSVSSGSYFVSYLVVIILGLYVYGL